MWRPSPLRLCASSGRRWAGRLPTSCAAAGRNTSRTRASGRVYHWRREMVDRIGFIGLGIMGRPMARNLLKAGFTLTVWNRSRPGIDELVAEGAAEGAGPADVARRSDIVITMVGDSPDVEEVALGPNGIVEGAHDGLVHIDMSTISPDVTRRIAERLAGGGNEVLD